MRFGAGLVSALFVGCAFGGAAVAGTVSIAAGSEPGSIVVKLEDATVVDLLRKLSERYGIELEGTVSIAGATRVSVQWSGSIEQIVRRALKTESYVLSGGTTALGAPGRIAVYSPGKQSAQMARAGGIELPEPKPDLKPAGAAANRGLAQDSPANHAVEPSRSRSIDVAGAAMPDVPVAAQVPQAVDNPAIAALPAGLTAISSHTQILAQQVSHYLPGFADLPVPRPINDSQALTQQALFNVQGLAGALRSICLGDNCSAAK